MFNQEDDAPTLLLYFDGACWPNPGGAASYGWRVLLARDAYTEPEQVAHGSGRVEPPPGGRTTNNLAEWEALRAALEWVRCLSGRHRLLIRGDSDLVIRQLRGEWGCKKPHLRRARDRCREILCGLARGGWGWSAEWLPREQNGECDRLAAAVT